MPVLNGVIHLANDIMLLDAPDKDPLPLFADLVNINSMLTILKVILDIEKGIRIKINK